MVLCAILLRVLGKLGILDVPLGVIRSLLYITLYIGWGIFAYRRILQIQVRRYMLAVSSLCVFWFVIRSMKYYLVTNVIFVRYIWYFYYLPMLFIPLFAVFISMSLGKPENFRLSNWAMGLYIPTTLLLLLVLTNDFHQLVFAFSDGAIWDDKHFSYAIGYYFVFGWEVFCAVASFGIMLTKCRLAQRTKYLPILLLCIAVIYAVINLGKKQSRQTAITHKFIGSANYMIGSLITVICKSFTSIKHSCLHFGQ
ncbi:histidine kinase N-terminal 7TM domain-containing protein [Anaerotignum faecicola]